MDISVMGFGLVSLALAGALGVAWANLRGLRQRVQQCEEVVDSAFLGYEAGWPQAEPVDQDPV